MLFLRIRDKKKSPPFRELSSILFYLQIRNLFQICLQFLSANFRCPFFRFPGCHPMLTVRCIKFLDVQSVFNKICDMVQDGFSFEQTLFCDKAAPPRNLSALPLYIPIRRKSIRIFKLFSESRMIFLFLKNINSPFQTNNRSLLPY